jgi:hypothetical protein
MAYNINDLPDDLPPGRYDVTLDAVYPVTTRDGKCEIIFETTYRGPQKPNDPTLLHIDIK